MMINIWKMSCYLSANDTIVINLNVIKVMLIDFVELKEILTEFTAKVEIFLLR